MTSRDFCYWLQGYFEIAHSGPRPPEPNARYRLDDYQIEMIRNHLAMVFKQEIDPSMGDKKHQDILSAAHGGAGPKSAASLGGNQDLTARFNC